jgi:hypothetical protein
MWSMGGMWGIWSMWGMRSMGFWEIKKAALVERLL